MNTSTYTIAVPSGVARPFASLPEPPGARGSTAGAPRPANPIRAALQAVRAWFGHARALDQLAHLDDRMLRDIGVDPSLVPERQHGNSLPLLIAALSR